MNVAMRGGACLSVANCRAISVAAIMLTVDSKEFVDGYRHQIVCELQRTVIPASNLKGCTGLESSPNNVTYFLF
ncbi:MAG: hypothetical protein ABI583_05225 [Betaproteobacteria bacterium]